MRNLNRVVCIGPDQNLRKICKRAVKKNPWKVDWAQSGFIALEALSINEYDVAIVDDYLPMISASELINEINKLGLHLPVISVVESDKRKGKIKQDFEQGLYAYLEKPLHQELLLGTLDEAKEYRQFILSSKEKFRSYLTMRGCGDIVGRSPSMLSVYKVLQQILDTDVTAAIYGESGTGKELIARFLHSTGPRKQMPFMSVNCAAIPKDLLESELFGYEKGAFTGATARKRGKFEVADKGTIFLDEIGDMSLFLQAKILKVIERGEFERVGGTDTKQVNVRIISATNQDLEKRIEEGKFREDLYHRINVFPIFLPPLRNRPGDLTLLAYKILSNATNRHGKKTLFFELDAFDVLRRNNWKGNIRELENVIERAVLMSENTVLAAEDFDSPELQSGEFPAQPPAIIDEQHTYGARDGRPQTLKEIEKMAIAFSIKRNEGNVSAAARELSISRATLYRKLKEYGLVEG